jgi:hypothetical protein
LKASQANSLRDPVSIKPFIIRKGWWSGTRCIYQPMKWSNNYNKHKIGKNAERSWPYLWSVIKYKLRLK